MELDERLRWFEARVTSSLKPRAEELKHLFSNEESRRCLLEFCNNEESRHLFVYFSGEASKNLVASFKAIPLLKSKALFFIKPQSAGKVTRDNINAEVFYCSCSPNAIKHLEIISKEIFLPLLSIEQTGGASADKLMDILHRLISSLQIVDGNVQGEVSLPLPSIEVLSEAAGYNHRKLVVIHILETFLIGWIKQIKNSLKLDPDIEIARRHGKKPGPLCEAEAWANHLERIRLINEQLCSPVIVNILMNLEEANSTYAQSFHNVKREISKAENEADENLQFLTTMSSWFEAISYSRHQSDIIPNFAPLMHTLFLVWQHSRYYHKTNNLIRLLKMISNEVAKKARDLMVGNVLDDLMSAHSNLKEALLICASFRGQYLDIKDKADLLNQQKLAEQVGTRSDNARVVWHSRLFKEAKTQRGTTVFGREKDQRSENDVAEAWDDSPWPARNSPVFVGLNSFMERCNDVGELVETTRHFRMLRNAAEVGGAGGQGLDAMVREIHDKFEAAMIDFKGKVHDMLDIDHAQQFERGFFVFRSVIRDLESRLGGILKESFKQCWDIRSRLRLLEVFEGTSSRDLVQKEIRSTMDAFVGDLLRDVIETRELFEKGIKAVHQHIPPLANELFWLESLKARLKVTMEKLKLVSPASLKGDDGWKLREIYSELMIDIDKSERSLYDKWQNTIGSDLRLRLKKPLLVFRTADDGSLQREVNIDDYLREMLREVHHLQRPPIEHRLPDVIRSLIRNTDPALLQTNAARLSTVVSQHNTVKRIINDDIERPLFEMKLATIEQLLQEGHRRYAWQDVEATDFIERATNLVCNDVFKNVGIVINNSREIVKIAESWSTGDLDAFGMADDRTSMYIDELHSKQKSCSTNLCHAIEADGRRIHELLKSIFEAVQISRASPSWLAYTQHISGIVYNGLKRSVLSSLDSMLRRIADAPNAEPILTIRLELVASEITFTPPLTKSSATHSLQEYVDDWLKGYLSRASCVASVCEDENFMEMMKSDYEIVDRIVKVNAVVAEKIDECKKYLDTFKDFAFLWMQDVKFTFDEFLQGNISSKSRDQSRLEDVKSSLSNSSRKDKETYKSSSRGSSAVTAMGTIAFSEKTMLAVKRLTLSKEDNAPSLDDFDRELEVYRGARDQIHAVIESCEVGWIKVNMQPIKKTIQTYASKWVFTFTKYLTDQVSSALNDLDAFLKRIEPGVEAITGEERDIISFMRLMRIFNEVTAQQSELDTKFATMKRTLSVLEKYEQKLPETTQKFYAAAPLRWNNLKMKVNQAKKRLGPRIQAEALDVTKTLRSFGERCSELDYEFRSSDAFNRSCFVYNAHTIMDSIEKSLNVIESEAQDLVELQELLEEDVVDFTVLPSLRSDLGILRQVWETAKLIHEQQSDWKRHRWQKIRPKLLRKLLNQQEDMVKQLPDKASDWDVTIGLLQSIQIMMSCVPIMEDLNKAAMRTRHWKQLVRATGGAVNISSDDLTKMSLGQFIDLGLQNHADEVHGVIQRAAKDVGIEKTLKTYEEVWLSKTFELVKHTRLSTTSTNAQTYDTPASEYGNESDYAVNAARPSGSRVSLTSMGLRAESRQRSASIFSSSTPLRQSVLNFVDQGEVHLLNNVEPILEELELHQLSLQSMFGGSAASSFADDIIKWQKTLQNLEAVLVLWWEVQQKWMKLDDVYNGTNCRVGLPKETNLFASSSNDFRHILKVTEKNPNVLQICTKEDIHTRLEKINSNFESCLKALMNHLEGRKQKFPRLYLLSQEDVLDIVCKGYDPGQINPYLSKILRNGCLLDYELQEVEEKKFYQITGIRSVHGEVLKLVKPVDCDSVVENWLSSVTNAIKLTLQTSLANALAMPLPESLHTSISPTLEVIRQSKSETKVKSPQRKVIFAAETGAVHDLEETARTDMNLQSSWSLRNVNEIVILALQIELTKKFEKSFEVLQSGNKSAIENLHQNLIAILQSAAAFLQGADESSGLHEVIDLNEDTASRQPNLESNEQELTIKEDAVTDENEAESKTDKHIVLLPNEIQKLTNLVFILSGKRDLAKRLSNMITSIDQNENEGERQISKTFEWQSQLKYYWSQPNATCKISVMDFDCEYGFEYQGTATRMVATPESERALFWASQGFAKNSSCLIIGSSLCGKEELILELSNAFGYPAYKFVCSDGVGTRRLAEIFKGIASTGSWVIFQNVNRLSSSAMSVITQLISNVSESLKAKKTSTLSLDEEIPLSPNSKLFATLELSKCVTEARTLQSFPRIASSLYSLPSELLAQFRPVCISTPDMLCVLKMHLIVCGFTFAEELANELTKIHSSWSSLSMATAAPSLKVLCGMIADAGDHLNKVLSVESVQKMTEVEIGKVVSHDTSSQGSESLVLSATEAVLIANSPEKVDEINDTENADYDAISEKTEPVNLQSDEHIEFDLKSIEQRSIVLALRSTIAPSLSGADAVMFATLIGDNFPNLNVPLMFDGDVGDDNVLSITDETIGLSLEKEKGAPLHSLPNSPQPKDQALHDFEAAVHIAVQRLELLPGSAFVSRVVQLSQLVSTHRTVIVAGPPGCGKTACIRSLVAAHRGMGHNIIYDSMYLGISESEELFGHKKKSGGWVDGFMPSVLRKKLHDICKSEIGMKSPDSRDLRWIHLDGKVDSSQMRFLSDVLTGDDDVTLPNSERVHLPATIRFIWEIDILDDISPSLLSNSGILSMNTQDVGWRLVMQNWLSKQPDSSREILKELCRRYIQTTIDFLVNEKIIRTESEMQKTVIGYYHTHGQMQHVVSLSNLQIVKNLFSIYEALIFNAQDPTSESLENFFNFAAFWAFGGNLIEAHREHFSNWWKDKWSEFVAYPEDVSLWQCKVHPETHEFINVADVVPVYSRKPNSSFSPDAHVATVQNMVTSHLIGALAESGKPTLLIGPSGCGKSHMIKDRLINNSSDMAEVQSLFINANKFITAKTLWQRMDELLEWKHTKTFVPKGNKRLICLIDDINYCHSSDSGSQSACETIRQLLDENGSFYCKGWKWRDIHDVTYLATYNPWTTVSTPPISNRLLNKWVVIYFPYPCEEETRTIFGTLIKTHFIPPRSLTNANQDGIEKVLSSEIIRKRSNEEAMRSLLTSIVAITVEVQENLRSMFLPTPERSHYIFTLNNLCIMFRNLCLALRSSCSTEDLILLWKHECENLYGAILIDQVDKERWMKAFYTAARKRLDKTQLEIVTQPPCLISNLVDMDDTTKKGSKNMTPSTESEEPVIAYRPIYDETKAKAILEHHINEHNKDNPKVKIYLYPETIKMISRLIRILQSPHESGHAMMLANGFPGMPLPMVKIAAYICGFTVFQIQPSTLVLGEKYTIEHFKLDIVNAYTTAGLKGEKLLFALNETELCDEDFLVYITEFLVSNSISHLFNEEEHTSITNAIRTDVTQAGLSYTKETAWNFFLRTVRENLRFVFIVSSMENKFPNRCRQFPGMINAMQILPLPHWTKDELVSCVLYHLKQVEIFDATEKENIAHLLASMHLAVSEYGGVGRKSGKLRYVTNTTFERFVEFFVELAQRRHTEIEKEHETISKTLEAIKRGSELAKQLKSQLEHEKIVLEQKKQGNFTLLSQIGQDKAITEEQVRLVRKQQWKIDKLEKLLPRYQDSHERAVFKAAAMVKETKHILAVLDQQGLSDLRSMQKPDSDVEDVLASIIIIIKSPTSDLTWNKGAKRIMANLERFRDDLAAFDEVEMTEDTLQVVEPYIKRPHFGSGFMEKKTSNSALESLVSWVRGVVKYHRMMLSRVKPLHRMVEQTRSALDEAVEKLGGMESKLKNLDNRMLSLSEKFEDASVDKSRQGLLTEEQQRQLTQAADFERLLASGTEQWILVLDSISQRRKSMVGSAAVSAGFATYLGPCNYQFRQTIIEKVWTECLRERGIAADTKIADNLTVNITMSMSSMSLQQSVDVEDVAMNHETEYAEEQNEQSEEEKYKSSEKSEGEVRDEESKAMTEESKPIIPESSARTENVQENDDEVSLQQSSKSLGDQQIEEVKTLISRGGHSYYLYDQHLLAHLMLLSGNGSQRNWISKGLNYRQLEEASIFVAAVQTPLFIIDPYKRAMQILDIIASDMVKIDMTQRNSTILNTIEKSVTAGDTLVIYNVENEVDSFLFPIIDHINTKSRLRMDEEPSVVKMNGRRLLIHPSFQLILIHSSQYPIIHEELASTMTVIDLRPNTNGIVRHFLLSAVERVRPDLSTEDKKIYYELFQCYDTLERLDTGAMALIRRKQGAGIWEETELITDIVKKRTQMAARFSQVILNLQRMHYHRAKFVPLAKCVSSAFNILLSLSTLRNEYQFPFDFIISLFELATGGKETEQSSKLIYLSVDCDKPKPRTPANKRKDEKSMKNASELLGVNLDKINHILAADGKEFNDFKGAEMNKTAPEFLVLDGPNELPEELEIKVPPTEVDVATDVPDMCKEFFRIFYKHVSKSLSSEHRNLFTLLCWLCMKITDFAAPDPDSIGILLEKEISKEHAISESRYPSWLPFESLNMLMSLSTSWPSMIDVIESIATDSNSWYSWYTNPAPDTLPLPMSHKEEEAPIKDSVATADDKEEAEEQSKDDEAIKTESVHGDDEVSKQQSLDMTKLLVIKCLRPDRFQSSMTTLCASDFNEFHSQFDYNFDELMSCTGDSKPVLILLPSSKDETHGIDDRRTFSSSYGADILAQKAKEKGLNLIQAYVFDGNEKMINLSLNNAVSTENWILIEDLHLGEANWLREFTKRVIRLHEQSDPKVQWRIIMTTEPCDKLPLQLLYLCEKVSLDALVAVNENLPFFSLNEQFSIIKENVVIALKCPSEQLWTESREKSLVHRDLLYTLCVAHGIMLSRQVFAPRTFTLKPRITNEDLLRSTEYASKYFESNAEKIKLSLHEICKVICEDIYCGKAINDANKDYIRMMFSCISNGLSSNLGSAIQFGRCSIAIPPANVDPLDYPNWFVEKAGSSEGDSLTLEFMHLDEEDGRKINEQRSTAFIEELRRLYEATLDEPFSTISGTNVSAEWIKLRQSVDLCNEKLPSLLKIDDCFGMTFSDIRQNPQLRSLSAFSEKSLLLSQKEELSTSISYCLLKECQWLNQLLFKISCSIEDLAKALISGMHAIPDCYKNILGSLCSNRVPDEWIHGYSDCKLKTLAEWLNDLSRAHSQLNTWLKRGVVPKPTSEPTTGRGNLELVDLSLLCNPRGLIDSLKYVAAVSNGVKLSEVPLSCYFSKRQNRLPSLPTELKPSDGVVLSGLFLEGASWDVQNGCLLEQQNTAEKLPLVFVTTGSSCDEMTVFHCPVFMNRCRQDMLFTLPLPVTSDEDIERFSFKGVYIMLDPVPVKV